MDENIIKSEQVGSSTLAHEQVAKEEDNIGFFFAAFAVQFLLTKDMLSVRQANPYYIKMYEKNQMFASQRVVINKIIQSKKYKHVVEELEALLLEYNQNQEKLPHDVYLSRTNKAFLIRQIFSHHDQILSKYEFINSYVGKEIVHLDLEELHNSMWSLPIDQQIMIVARIFIGMHDDFENKKKSIKDSFLENINRIKAEYVRKNKTQSAEYLNLEMFASKFGG